MFCGPETANVSRGSAEGNMAVEGPQNILFPEVKINKGFVIYQLTIKEEQKIDFKESFIIQT